MLSAIGRASVRRVVAGPPKLTFGVIKSLWRLQRVNGFKSAGSALVSLQNSFSLQRSFATATKAPPKRAVKSTTTKTKPKTKAKPKPKKALKKKPAKKTLKKKVAKKPKKKAAKKVISPEVKARLDLKRLKQAALSAPTKLPSTAWMVYCVQASRNKAETVTLLTKRLSSTYQALSVAERESLERIANENKVINEAAYKQWVESLPPDAIRIANNARAQLRNKTGTKKTWTAIKDNRLPKHPKNAWMFFTDARRSALPSTKGGGIQESRGILKTIGKEWALMSASERKPYHDLADADSLRYRQEFNTVFNRPTTMEIEEARALRSKST